MAISHHPHFEAAVRATHSRPALPIMLPATVDHAVVMVGEAGPQEDHDRMLDALAALPGMVVEKD
ncbi:MAG: hypothetical protein KI785_04945, partial [Devosiaceae bacterium]|nr:hypothetical protein [Devosiaceae bacterium MH13]